MVYPLSESRLGICLALAKHGARHSKVKCAAPAVFAIDVERQSQLFDQTVHHGQAKPAAA